jgi:hypothetical protein
MLVSYLREATFDTSKFFAIDGVSGAYPFTPFIWTFTFDGELYWITYKELVEEPLPIGIILEFSTETAEDSKAMPQFWNQDVRILIRVPPQITEESVGLRMAQLIDKALLRSGGRCEIKDYEQNPQVSTNSYLTWIPTPRGNWEEIDDDSSFRPPRRRSPKSTEIEMFQLAFQVQYAQPESEL